MKINKWLAINNKGAVSITSKKPKLAANQIAININLTLPDSLFDKPSLVADITVPDEAVASQVTHTIVADNIEKIIEQSTGLNFAISVEKKDKN